MPSKHNYVIFIHYISIQFAEKNLEDSHVSNIWIKAFTVLLLLEFIEWTDFINLLSNLTELHSTIPDIK